MKLLDRHLDQLKSITILNEANHPTLSINVLIGFS